MYKNIAADKQSEFAGNVKLIQEQYSNYSPPSTKNEYWDIVDIFWVDLLSILLRFAPEFLEDPDRSSSFDRSAVILTNLKNKRDNILVKYFNKTWAAAPDDGHIHLIPCWHILCDLCSESYLVYEE